MCNQCADSNQEHGVAARGRREVLKAGAALVAAPLLEGVASSAQAARAAQTAGSVGNGPFSARA